MCPLIPDGLADVAGRGLMLQGVSIGLLYCRRGLRRLIRSPRDVYNTILYLFSYTYVSLHTEVIRRGKYCGCRKEAPFLETHPKYTLHLRGISTLTAVDPVLL